jgi:hypothetical protein
MKLLARILSHGFAIAVVLLLATGLIYRGELFPEYDLPGFLDIGKLADHQKDSTAGQESGTGQEQVTPQVAETGGKGETDAGGDSAADITAAVAPQPVPADSEVILRESETQPESAIQPEAVAETPEEDSAIESVVPVPDETEQQPLEEVPEAVAPPPEEPTPPAANDLAGAETIPEGVSGSADAAAPLPEPEAVIPQTTDAAAPPSKPQEKAYQLLAAAREAYWLRDYDIAESKYKSLTEVDPDNPDGYGELGNMYFSQGQWDEAASAYYEAGVRLIGQGLLEQAEELVAVIRGLNGNHADELDRKIKEARSTAD